MTRRARFALWLAAACGVVLVCAAGVAVLWSQSADLGERAVLLALAFFFLPFVLGWLVRRVFDAYPAAAERLADEVRVVRSANPERRIVPVGGAEMRQLAEAVNELADAHRALKHDVEARIAAANAGVLQEKNRLAAVMTELAHSVIVCNAEGRILLYNARAAQLLDDRTGAPVGLGRSIFGVLDKGAVVHALERLRQRLEQREADPVARFVTARGAQWLRAQMAPVLDAAGAIDGFVLLLEDVTRPALLERRREAAWRQLTEGTRASLANLRAAVETVQAHPQMDAARRDRLIGVIREEAEALSRRVEDAAARAAQLPQAPWPLEDLRAGALVAALQRSLESGPGVTAAFAGGDEQQWLSVDSHALVQALTHVGARLHAELGVRALAIELERAGRFARLGLHWVGRPLDPVTLHEWEAEPLPLAGEVGPATLAHVIERHGGEIWCHSDRASDDNRVWVQLPSATVEAAPAGSDTPDVAAASRPVYYDFDLFHQPGQTPELDQRPLASLSYTVFDTETTGLEPSEGDEIVSIGAVRIVNGRLLATECYEQLVDPRRRVRKAAQQVHGISDEMLAGQPGVDEVLPAFHRFAEDTVLVAHNAAFDMRFLQLKEAGTGVRFGQPVLDTLLLSALVHPGHSDADHRLEAIAGRLGVPVLGRHTALGDAIVTAEVLLKLLPLLAERGIHTLGQAREASSRTRYAKVAY